MQEGVSLAKQCVARLDKCERDKADLESTPCAEISIPDPFSLKPLLVGAGIGAILGSVITVIIWRPWRD